WNNLATVNNAFIHQWTVPNTVSGDVKVRVTAGGLQDESDSTFSIAPQVANVQITQVCPDSATFTWNSVTDAESYDLYLLGEKYMEVVGNSNTTTVTIPITNPNDPRWFAAVAKNE